MKVILVSGDDDYGALSFENSEKTVLEAYNLAVEAGGLYEEDDWWVKSYEFEGDVDPKFAEFVRNRIQDYDQSKHTDFYILKEGSEEE
jgi:hypothetical protein